MPDCEKLLRGLKEAGLADWCEQLDAVLRERLADDAHGDMRRWRIAIDELPKIADTCITLDTPAVTVASASAGRDRTEAIRETLMRMRPWRKGPFEIFGINLDAEWRSNLKWDRLADAITPLGGRRVLDVGCGNGYYAYRMTGAGARQVIGIDPTLLYLMQFYALNRLFDVGSITLLPLRLSELPDAPNSFDTTFSMGVLYHQRDAGEHLEQLRGTLRRGGELVLETLILPGDEVCVREPAGRYARMRNVWQLPTAAALLAWLREAGFDDIRLTDVTVTTVDEQRSTEWMPFESLEEALDPEDPSRTIEGLPAPARALVICRAP